jgi:hypothetical protein
MVATKTLMETLLAFYSFSQSWRKVLWSLLEYLTLVCLLNHSKLNQRCSHSTWFNNTFAMLQQGSNFKSKCICTFTHSIIFLKNNIVQQGSSFKFKCVCILTHSLTIFKKQYCATSCKPWWWKRLFANPFFSNSFPSTSST